MWLAMTLSPENININRITPPSMSYDPNLSLKTADKDEEKAGMLLGALVGLGTIGLAACYAIKTKQKAKILEKFPLNTTKIVLTDPWVDDYIKLCRKYGKKVRTAEDGVAGDWLHYQELLLKDTNPEKYKRYLADREIKAKTDETTRILKELDEMGT